MPDLVPRTADLARVAVDSFIEGGVGETIAALAAYRAAGSCTEPTIRDALRKIAGDEERHAALAWETVAWAVAEGGPKVAAALRAAACDMGRALTAATVELREGAPSNLATLGRLDPVALDEVRDDAWHQVIAPLLNTALAA